MKASNIIFSAFVAMLFSCNNTHPKPANDNQPVAKVIKQVSDTMQAEVIVEDTLCIPCDTAYQQSILISGLVLHGDEVPANAKNRHWYGLFKSGKGYYIDTTKIKIETRYDPILDPEDSSERTGKLIHVLHKDSSVLLISNAKLPAGYVTENLVNPQRFIYPEEDTIIFKSNGINYKLYSTAIKGLTKSYSDTGYYNYKLYLSGTKNGKAVTQLLRATQQAIATAVIIGILICYSMQPTQFYDFVCTPHCSGLFYCS